MKALIPLFFVATSVSALEFSDWALNEIKSASETVGYVYNTYAVGTQVGAKTEKIVTDFRFVCSIKGSANPIIAIRWVGRLAPNQGQYITVSIDNIYSSTDFWGQNDKNTFFREVLVSQAIVDAIKKGKQLKISWISTDAVKYNAIYNITNVNQKLNMFNAACGTNI